ncbi:MAG TPA: Rieske (2Fe-2S) protein [Acidobacteriota bacterium]|nr:Rieske (2Fe-2S) protein [Acidobacteriota bacterium]
MNDKPSVDLERRGVLVWLTRGFLALWAPAAAGVGASFLKAPSTEHRPGERQILAGPLSSLAIGDARFVRHGTEPVFVVRVSESEVLAVSAICTHMRCVLRWNRENGTFLCPCHDGSFDRNGNVLAGPPKKPLRQFQAEVRADEIVVRT